MLPSYRLVEPGTTYPGIATDYCQSVAHLRTLQPDIFLAQHGSFIRLSEKAAALDSGHPRAFVDPQGYRLFLDRAEAGIEQALADQGRPGGCDAVLGAGTR